MAACLAGAVVLMSCGDPKTGTTAADPETTPTGPITLVDGDVLVSCGSGTQGWPSSVMVDGIEPPEPVAAITSALSSASVAPRLRKDWKVLAADNDEITLALGSWGDEGPARDAMYLVLVPDGDGWHASSGGNCWHLAPVLGSDASWVDVSADDVATDATELAVTVTERQCTGARDPLPHLHEPDFVVADDAITVYWTSNPPGAAECPSNPPTGTTLTLPEPLGDRELLDGSPWPPVPICRLA